MDKCAKGFVDYTGQPFVGDPFAVTYLIDSNQDRTANNPTPSTAICFLRNRRWRAADGVRTLLGRPMVVDVGGDHIGQRT